METKVTHSWRLYNTKPVAFYVTLEGKIPRTPISDEQALNVIAQLRTPHLDGGELILTFGGQENKPSNLFTGDKRALKAVNRMQCNGVFALDGCHVLVLEEAIRLLMICGDKEQVIARIQAHPLVDKAIDICFRNTGSVDNALNSYIEYPF